MNTKEEVVKLELVESRIAALEAGQVQLRKDLSEVAISQKELYKQQALLDKNVNTLLIQIQDHFAQSAGYEKTIRNIDNTLNNLSLKYAASPMERHKEIQIIVDPIYSTIRDHETKFARCSEETKASIRKEAKSHIILIWLSLIVFATMAMYILEEEKTDIYEKIGSYHESSSSSRPQTK